MFNRTTSTKFITPRRPRAKILNPKHEIRNKPRHSNSKFEIQNEIVWNFLFFDHLDLFRTSDFEFRICNFNYTWRPLRLCARHPISGSVFESSVEKIGIHSKVSVHYLLQRRAVFAKYRLNANENENCHYFH